ncbi:hypothetical protein S140_5 [Shewanella sp. phage 1/40]|uniref:hypothetical protein n=1 Tax=Shewanella sp. phage 1/40 TaxID=1458860 RepID=UPI0004F67561|nr:hypothetical protein S140_5 [Shewanella sp. phage 1/40]AHK11415.1 hypothetical protein S140_5 [Shewanella sp. phage 1/40]
MTKFKTYILCSLIGANLHLIFGGVACAILSFLTWDINPLMIMWNAFIESYTTHKIRAVILMWFIFGNILYLTVREINNAY